MRRLDRLKLPECLVELDIGDHRRIEHVILVVVMPEEGSEFGRPGRWNQASTISTTSRSRSMTTPAPPTLTPARPQAGVASDVARQRLSRCSVDHESSHGRTVPGADPVGVDRSGVGWNHAPHDAGAV